MNKGGAPCKLTKEVHEIIVQAVRKGLPWCHAAALAGIDRGTLIEWRNKGDKEKSGKFYQLSHDIEKAHAEWVQERLDKIREAGENGNWTADAWQLERRDQENFSLKTKHEITGEKGGPVEVKITFDD